ncbi:MAG: hypothetical protein WBD27_15970 [Pyrinomonadaceae bacterium]
MPDYELIFYLTNGNKATIKLKNVNGTAQTIEANIQTQLKQPDNDFHLANNTVVVRLKKNEISGYSIDEL